MDIPRNHPPTREQGTNSLTARELADALANLPQQEAPVVIWATRTGETIPMALDIGQARVLAASWDDAREVYVIHTTTTESDDMQGDLTRGPVTIDGLVTVEAVYDPSERWNGWLMPRMDRQAVEAVMAAFQRDLTEIDPTPPSHRWDGDDLILTEYDGDDEYSETLRPDADGLYSLGAGSWVWSEGE